MLHFHTKISKCGIRSWPPIQNDDILPCFLFQSFFYAQEPKNAVRPREVRLQKGWVRGWGLKQYVYVYRSTLVSWTFLAVPALLTGWAFCSGLATLLPSRMLLRVVCCWLLWASSRCCGGLWSPSRRGCWLLWASSRWYCRPIATLSPPSLKTRIPVKDAVYRVLMIETNFHVTNRWWYWSE